MKVRLGDVCTIVSGSTPKTNVSEYWDGEIKWITPAELSNDSFYIFDSSRHLSEEAMKKTGLKLFPTGTVILSSRAPIGKTAISGCEMCCNQGFKNLICSDRIFNEYLYFYLKSKTEFLNSLGRGATFKEISKGIVEEIEIPLPTYDEQKRIANELKKVTELIYLRKLQLIKLEELIKSQFIEMFGDPVTNTQGRKIVPFKDFILNIRYGTSQPPVFNQVGKYRFIRATNIKAGRISEQNMLMIDENAAAGLEKCKLIGGEIIIVRSGVNTGDTCIVTDAYVGDYAGYDIIVSLDRSICNPVFFNEMINTHYMEKVVKPLTARSAQPHINAEQVQNLPIVYASLSEQNRFADFIQQVDKSKFEIGVSLEKLEVLKNALMQESFG